MCKISALIVVYNKRIAECAAFASLAGIGGVDIYVADNSTRDMGNKAFAHHAGFTYISMHGNAGLSKAYNTVIDKLEKNNDILCLFDDDTTIFPDYFEALREDAAAYQSVDIFAPIVTDAKGMLSPCVFKGLRGRRASCLNDIPEHSISVINSGLAVRTKVFGNCRFDEDLFLDYVDHAFIKCAAGQCKSKIRIMDVTLTQQFSGSQKLSKRDAVRRYQIFRKDVTVFAGKYGAPKWRVWLLLARRLLKLIVSTGL